MPSSSFPATEREEEDEENENQIESENEEDEREVQSEEKSVRREKNEDITGGTRGETTKTLFLLPYSYFGLIRMSRAVADLEG